MKKSIFFNSLVIVFLFSACSSPENDAKKIADKFNETLKEFDKCETPQDFDDLRSRANEQTTLNYSECEEKYQNDPEKLQAFYDVYHQETDSLIAEYNKAFSQNIQSILGNEYWYKPCIKDGYYNYTFNDGVFHIVGCKKGIPYTMNGDTLIFDDKDNSKLTIIFWGSEEFSLTNVETGNRVPFKKSNDRAKVCGLWNGSVDGISCSLNFKNNGKVNLSAFGNSLIWKWEVKDDKLSIDGSQFSKITFKDENTMSNDGATWHRKIRETPQSIKFLFDEDNQVEDPGKKVSSYSNQGSNDWDQILDDYEKYVDDYIQLYKKAMAGDMTAMSKYASVLSEAQELSSKLSNASGELSSSQLQRFQKIMSKMSSAL